MQSGKLRHRITIQTETTTIADNGEQVRTWATFATLWADVRNKKEKEELQSDAVIAKSTHSVKIRYTDGINTKMKIIWGSRTLQIDGIMADRTDAKNQIINCTEIG